MIAGTISFASKWFSMDSWEVVTWLVYSCKGSMLYLLDYMPGMRFPHRHRALREQSIYDNWMVIFKSRTRIRGRLQACFFLKLRLNGLQKRTTCLATLLLQTCLITNQVAASWVNTDWIKLRGSHAIHGSTSLAAKQVCLGPEKTHNMYRFCCKK